MAHLLHVEASFAPEGSVSRSIGAIYVDAWRQHNPDGVITHRDLAVAPPPHLSWTVVSAGFVPPEQHSPEQAEAVKIREEYIAEVEAADEYLLTVPMYNWSIPSTLKAWLDHVILLGRTTGLPNGCGVMTGKKVTVVTAQGGAYGPGAPKEGWDHQRPYLAHALEALGGTDVEFVNVEMTLSTTNPELAQFTNLFESSRAAAEQAVRARAAA